MALDAEDDEAGDDGDDDDEESVAGKFNRSSSPSIRSATRRR
jgi:hypothetical protein